MQTINIGDYDDIELAKFKEKNKYDEFKLFLEAKKTSLKNKYKDRQASRLVNEVAEKLGNVNIKESKSNNTVSQKKINDPLRIQGILYKIGFI